MSKKLKIGFIARADNSGLGVLSYDFYKNLDFYKVLVVSAQYECRYERYDPNHTVICDKGVPTMQEARDFIKDLDLIFAIETPYQWNIFKLANDKGIKNVLMVMYEWTPEKSLIPFAPDLYLCPTEVDYKALWQPKIQLSVPTSEVKNRQITEAKTFVFNNGHGGAIGRNSIAEFLQAIQMVKSNVKFLVHSQRPIEIEFNDSRLEIIAEELPFEELWRHGDIYIHLHKYEGLSLPLQESFSAGMPAIVLDRPPYNQFISEKLLLKPDGLGEIQLPQRKVAMASVSARMLAEKIDEIAQASIEEITEWSKKATETAKLFSWETLKPKYEQIFEDLCSEKQIGGGK